MQVNSVAALDMQVHSGWGVLVMQVNSVAALDRFILVGVSWLCRSTVWLL